MNCPNQKCRAKETRVKEVTVYKTFKYRIRFCPNCGTTFQTHEKIIEDIWLHLHCALQLFLRSGQFLTAHANRKNNQMVWNKSRLL